MENVLSKVEKQAQGEILFRSAFSMAWSRILDVLWCVQGMIRWVFGLLAEQARTLRNGHR